MSVVFPAPLPPTTPTLAGVEIDGHSGDGADAAEGDLDVPHLHDRNALHRCAGRLGRSDHQLTLRRKSVSRPTATTRTTPTTMSCVGESTSRSTIPERSDCLTTAPRLAPGPAPRPP